MSKLTVIDLDEAKNCLFVLKSKIQLKQEDSKNLWDTWTALWNLVSDGPKPALVILPPDMYLTALSDDELRTIGLQKIK